MFSSDKLFVIAIPSILLCSVMAFPLFVKSPRYIVYISECTGHYLSGLTSYHWGCTGYKHYTKTVDTYAEAERICPKDIETNCINCDVDGCHIGILT